MKKSFICMLMVVLMLALALPVSAAITLEPMGEISPVEQSSLTPFSVAPLAEATGSAPAPEQAAEEQSVSQTPEDTQAQVFAAQQEVVESTQSSVASGTCGENLTWTLDDAGTLTISGTGNMSSWSSLNAPWDSKRSAIKKVVVEKGVTTIGDNVFWECNALISVTIPNSVTTIGDNAFCFCNALTSVTMGNSVTTIGDGAFSDCNALTSVTIPNSVTTIGDRAFDSCGALTSVTIPDSVTTIGDNAFLGCDALTSVTIPNSVTTIGDWTFAFCHALTSVTIPDSVTAIGGWAFLSCGALTSVTMGNSVTTIGYGAFRDCNALTDVYYQGNEADRARIDIDRNYNDFLLNATWHYNSSISGGEQENLTAYEQEYIDQHLSFLANGTWNDCLDRRYAEIIADGLNTPTANFADTMYKVLNTGDELSQCKMLSIFENPYDAILIDLICSQTNTQLKSFELNYGKEFTTQVSNLQTICAMYSGDWKVDTEFLTSLEKLIKEPESMKESNLAFYDLCQEAFGHLVKDDDQLEEWIGAYGKAADLVSALDNYKNVVEWVSDCVKYNALVEAFCETSDQFKATLMLADYVMSTECNDSVTSAAYAGRFHEAVEKYLAFTDKNLTDADIAAMLFEEYFTNGVVRIADVFGDSVTKQTVTWVSAGLGLSKTAASWVYAVIFAYNTGWSLSEAITSNGAIMDCRELLRVNYYLERAVTEVAKSTGSALQQSQTYTAALNFDAAFSVFKQCQIYSLSTYADYLDVQQSSFIRWIFNTHFKGNQSEIDLITLLTSEWKNTLCHNVSAASNVYSTVKVACPTDVAVYNAQDQLVLSIENNQITYRDDSVAAYVSGDTKMIGLPNLSEYRIESTATDNGTMSYIVNTFIANHALTSSTNYDNLSIKKDEVYTGTAEIDSNNNVEAKLTYDSEEVKETYSSTNGSTPVYVTSLSLSKSAETLSVGTTTTLQATLQPEAVTCATLAWTSSNQGVATVDENGVVTGVSNGTANIRCSAVDGSGIYADCTVSVTNSTVAVTGITLNKTNLSLEKGSSATLTATVTPTNATDKNVTWTSSNTNVATVSGGEVTAVGVGSASITAKTGNGKTVTCNVTVTDHTWDAGKVTKAATCTATGVKTYTCSGCGETKTETIAKTGHKAVKDAAVAATCTETGLTEGKHCSVCNEVLEAQEEVEALGHTEVVDKAVAPTCTETGLTEGKHCSVCNEVLVAQEEVKALGHKWDSGVVTKQPSTAEEGIKTYTCTRCDADYTESIPKLTIDIVFSDVSKGKDWFAPYVYDLVEQGILNGKGTAADGTPIFEPQGLITRAEFSKILAAASGEDLSVYDVPCSFEDASGHWASKYINWAFDKGIVTGFPDGTFGAGKNITREQMALMICRYADYKEVDLPQINEKLVFKDDASIGGWSKDSVYAMQQAGIINGYDEGDGYTFKPQGNATRAESATMISKFLDM